MLRDIASAKKAGFLKSLIGMEVEAITLQSRGGAGFTEALTDNYLKARVAGNIDSNQWLRFDVEAVDGEWLIGRPATSLRERAERPFLHDASYSEVP